MTDSKDEGRPVKRLMWQRTRSKVLPLGAFLILALLTTPWLTLPYSRLDWVAFSQPYEPTSTAITTPSPSTPPAHS